MSGIVPIAPCPHCSRMAHGELVEQTSAGTDLEILPDGRAMYSDPNRYTGAFRCENGHETISVLQFRRRDQYP